MRGSSASSSDNYIIRQQYSRYPSWPAPHVEGKLPRSQSSKSVQENPTSPQSAPPASLSRKYLPFIVLFLLLKSVFNSYPDYLYGLYPVFSHQHIKSLKFKLMTNDYHYNVQHLNVWFSLKT